MRQLRQEMNNALGIGAGSLMADTRKSKRKLDGSWSWELRYTGRGLIEHIGSWMYAGKEDLYLIRKYNKYTDVVKSRELRGTPNE